MKVCSQCGEKKPFTEFSKHRWNDGLRPDCKACVCVRSRRRAQLLGTREMTARKHGINAALFEEVWTIQGKCCAICGTPADPKVRAPAIDHDHTTSRLRGILCARCNGGLGMFKDDPALLRRAVVYLDFYRDGWQLLADVVEKVRDHCWTCGQNLNDPAIDHGTCR